MGRSGQIPFPLGRSGASSRTAARCSSSPITARWGARRPVWRPPSAAGWENGVVEDSTRREEATESLLFTGDALGRHPILTGRSATERVSRVGTFSGQSLRGPPGAVALLRFGKSAVETDHTGKVKTSAAGLAQALAVTHGRGRVVVLGEAAMLTSQLSGPGKVRWGGLNNRRLDNQQFALNVLHWLFGLL